MNQKFLFAFVILLAALTAGCGATTAPTSHPGPVVAPSFLYALHPQSNMISGFEIGLGSSEPISGSPFANQGSDPAGAVAMGSVLYVANHGSANISAFRVDAQTGFLTPISGSPFPSAGGPRGLAVCPNKFLYAAADSGGVSAYSLGASGQLTRVIGSPFAAGSAPVAVDIVVTPTLTCSFLYVANSNSNDVSAFVIDATTGALTPVAGSPFAAGTAPSAIAVAAPGVVYVANSVSNNISAFAIDPTSGALTAVAGSPFPAGTAPSSVVAGPGVFVTNERSNNVSGYIEDIKTGALTPMPGSPFAAGQQPKAALIADLHTRDIPEIFDLCVANHSSNDISVFDSEGSRPTFAFSFPVAAGPVALAAACPGCP